MRINDILKPLIILTLLPLLIACVTDNQAKITEISKKADEISFVPPITNNTQRGRDQVYYIPEGDTYIQPKDMPSIIAQVNYLKNHSTSTVLLIGNADVYGSNEYNFALGWKYAQALANILLEHGVLINQINVVSYGREESIDLWHNRKTMSLNRRVILHYYENN